MAETSEAVAIAVTVYSGRGVSVALPTAVTEVVATAESSGGRVSHLSIHARMALQYQSIHDSCADWDSCRKARKRHSARLFVAMT